MKLKALKARKLWDSAVQQTVDVKAGNEFDIMSEADAAYYIAAGVATDDLTTKATPPKVKGRARGKANAEETSSE